MEEDSKIFPKIIDSYILCKYADGITSKNIIKKSNFNKANLEKTTYIKNIKGDPQISIYDSSGKSIYKGYKSGIHQIFVPISRYDIKVKGISFDEKVLFY